MLLSQIEEVVKWNDWFKFLSPFELESIHFYSMSLMAFELYSQILQPLESLMIHVMYVIPMMENEKICKAYGRSFP